MQVGAQKRTALVHLPPTYDERGMTVQFEDRADTNYIQFSDRQWMDFITVN